MDGIPGVTQNAVQPGKSFVYEFKATVPGTYWYHSHQDGANQVDKGLYGAFIVEGTDEKVDRDYTLVLDEWMSMGDMDMSSMDNSSMNMDMSSMDHSNMNMDSSKDQASSENNMDHGNMGDDAHGSSAEGHDMSMYDIYSINGKSGDSIDKLIVKKGRKKFAFDSLTLDYFRIISIYMGTNLKSSLLTDNRSTILLLSMIRSFRLLRENATISNLKRTTPGNGISKITEMIRV